MPNTASLISYAQELKSHFESLYAQTPLLVRSPGRVNLIGEHTDYNMGFVLPAAINKSIYLAIQKREDDQVHLSSLDYKDTYSTTLSEIKPSGKLWPDYILGVIEQLQKQGFKLGGFNLAFGGDIPEGAGLSSSAALECASGFAFNELFNLGLERIDVVKNAQAAENQFVGVKCGIMDQFASVFGKKQHLVRLDCQTLEYTYIPFRAPDVKIVLFDTRVKHSLASSAYNERREQCEAGVALIAKHHPEVTSLRYATEDMLLTYVKPVDEIIYQRCTYIVAEIKRLLDGCIDLENNDLPAFGQKMFESHNGLQNLYEVSCPELDHLVDLVRNNENVYGARMMGGGFGGCTINLVKSDAIDALIDEVTIGYKKLTGRDVMAYIAQIDEGTSVIE
jgi:galactokinase